MTLEKKKARTKRILDTATTTTPIDPTTTATTEGAVAKTAATTTATVVGTAKPTDEERMRKRLERWSTPDAKQRRTGPPTVAPSVATDAPLAEQK